MYGKENNRCINISCHKELTIADINYSGRLCFKCLQEKSSIVIRAKNLHIGDTIKRANYRANMKVRGKTDRHFILVYTDSNSHNKNYTFIIGTDSMELVTLLF